MADELMAEFDELVMAVRMVGTAAAMPGGVQETIDAMHRLDAVFARIATNPASAYNNYRPAPVVELDKEQK